jgi:hypothetical protein
MCTETLLLYSCEQRASEPTTRVTCNTLDVNNSPDGRTHVVLQNTVPQAGQCVACWYTEREDRWDDEAYEDDDEYGENDSTDVWELFQRKNEANQKRLKEEEDRKKKNTRK